MTQSAVQLSAISRLFSSAVIHEFARNGRSALFRRLFEMASLTDYCESHATVGDVFEVAFRFLRVAGQRDEYVYRAAITQRMLMGRHNLNTAVMLSEFRAGNCKADLVILNGTAKAYEIKSERDSLARLANQVANYKRVFAEVNVISSESHIDAVRDIVCDDVGLVQLSNRYQIHEVRKGVNRPDRICPLTVFDSLQSVEAVAILKALGIPVPDVPNTQRRNAMRVLFAKMDPATLHAQMVQTLKATRSHAPICDVINNLPKSLHAAALSTPVRRSDYTRLVQVIKMPLKATTAWV